MIIEPYPTEINCRPVDRGLAFSMLKTDSENER
jgi:hypothetical protein